MRLLSVSEWAVSKLSSLTYLNPILYMLKGACLSLLYQKIKLTLKQVVIFCVAVRSWKATTGLTTIGIPPLLNTVTRASVTSTQSFNLHRTGNTSAIFTVDNVVRSGRVNRLILMYRNRVQNVPHQPSRCAWTSRIIKTEVLILLSDNFHFYITISIARISITTYVNMTKLFNIQL